MKKRRISINRGREDIREPVSMDAVSALIDVKMKAMDGKLKVYEHAIHTIAVILKDFRSSVELSFVSSASTRKTIEEFFTNLNSAFGNLDILERNLNDIEAWATDLEQIIEKEVTNKIPDRALEEAVTIYEEVVDRDYADDLVETLSTDDEGDTYETGEPIYRPRRRERRR